VGRVALCVAGAIGEHPASNTTDASLCADPGARQREALLGGRGRDRELLKRGEGWLSQHPEKELIVQRYLKRQRSLTREALERLTEDALPEEEAKVSDRDEEEQKVERPLNLNEQRMGAVLSALCGVGAKRVLDLGCGEGKLLRSLLADHQFEQSWAWMFPGVRLRLPRSG